LYFNIKDDSKALECLFSFCGKGNLNTPDYYGLSALAVSVNRGNYEGAKFLLNRNADIKLDSAGGYYILRTAVLSNKPGNF
jgi:hypothetical protein